MYLLAHNNFRFNSRPIFGHSRPPNAKNNTTCSILSTPIIVNESQIDINVLDSFYKTIRVIRAIHVRYPT